MDSSFLHAFLLASSAALLLVGSASGCRRDVGERMAEPATTVTLPEAPSSERPPVHIQATASSEAPEPPTPEHDPDAGLDAPQILGLGDIGEMSGWQYRETCASPEWRTKHLAPPPKATFRVTSAPGEIAPDKAAEEIGRRSGEYLACCFAGYTPDARFEGSAELTVSPAGSVTRVGGVKTPMHLYPDRFLCVQKALQRPGFGPLKGEAKITVGFAASPSKVTGGLH